MTLELWGIDFSSAPSRRNRLSPDRQLAGTGCSNARRPNGAKAQAASTACSVVKPPLASTQMIASGASPGRRAAMISSAVHGERRQRTSITVLSASLIDMCLPL